MTVSLSPQTYALLRDSGWATGPRSRTRYVLKSELSQDAFADIETNTETP